MKASEILQNYRYGERDFRHANLKGESFQGQTLSEADFSQSDIRGTNFIGTDLRGASFRGSTFALETYWLIAWLLIAAFLSIFIGICSFVIGVFIAFTFSDVSLLSSIMAILLSLSSVFFLLRFGGRIAIPPSGWAIIGVVAGTIAGTIAGGFYVKVALTMAIIGAGIGALTGIGIIIMTAVELVTFMMGGRWLIVLIIAVEFLTVAAMISIWRVAQGWVFLSALAIVVPGLYLLQRERQQRWIRPIILGLISLGGTRFTQANLTGADFTGIKFKA
jgi:hypothetical protein